MTKTQTMKTLQLIALLLAAMFIASCSKTSDGWISLFDGESLDGWTASENTDAWKIVDGTIVTGGERSHLFYTGEVLDHNSASDGEVWIATALFGAAPPE